MTEPLELAAAGIAQAINRLNRQIEEQPPSSSSYRLQLGRDVDHLTSVLERATATLVALRAYAANPAGRIVEVSEYDEAEDAWWTVDITPTLAGNFGDWSWELGHGAETVVLTIDAVAATQARPAEALIFAASIEAQARAVLEGTGYATIEDLGE